MNVSLVAICVLLLGMLSRNISEDLQFHRWLGLVFVASFLFQNISGTFLSADSANFVSIAQTLQVPLSTLFWIIFPNLNTSSFVTPISYVIPAMLLLLFGSILWKVWESQEKERLAKVWDYSINYFM